MLRIALPGLLLVCASPSLFAQCASCQPNCAAPCDPTCAVPSGICDPNCAAPSGCSTGYQPQTGCDNGCGLFGHRVRPLFNWTKIEIENKERCCPQTQCCQPQCQQGCQTVQAMPMSYQPVQVQFTAYQPMMAAPMMAAPMMAAPMAQPMMAAPMMAAQPMMTAAPMMAAPMMAPAAVRPAAAPQSDSDDCNLSNVCAKLNALRERVDELSEKVNAQKDTSDLERRVGQLEESSKLQTEILQEMKTYFEKKKE